jgi:hypothetical protein
MGKAEALRGVRVLPGMEVPNIEVGKKNRAGK